MDQSYWDGLLAEREDLAVVPRPARPPRPRSAIEGGQLDHWLEHLQRLQKDLLRDPGHDKRGGSRSWRSSTGNPPSSRDSSTYGSVSSPGSQESLQSAPLSPERRGSWDRARIMHTPVKERAQLCSLPPVKIGWLPIQRRVTVGGAPKSIQGMEHPAGQVKLKQPIAPIIQTSRGAANNRHQDEEEEEEEGGSRRRSGAARDWWSLRTAAQEPPATKQALVSYADRPVGWQALRRGWNSNRAPTFPEGSRSDPLQVSPHRGSPAQQRPPLQGENGGGGGGWPRTQPLRATAPLGPSESPSSLPSSHIQTSSAVTTLVPENRAGFSSITISSRKVSRSASLPGSAHPGQSPSPPPPAANQPMDPNSRQLTLKRQATIVKVTEQRTVLSSPGPEPGPGAGPEGSSGSLSTHQATDTVVRRRQATIIKVTERRQSFTPVATAGGRKPEYRHSYAGVGHQGDYTLHRTSTHPSPDGVLTPDKASLHTDSVHRSTLSLTLSGHATVAPPPATAVAPPSLPHMRPGRSARSVRPHSCYGNVSEPSKELVTAAPPAARKWSFGEGGDPMGPLERRASPSLTLIKAPDPHSNQTAEEVLALNAAAVIANIKLQRKLSKKKTPEEDSAPGNTGITTVLPSSLTDCAKPQPDQSQAQRRHQPPAAFILLGPDRAAGTFSLQEALQRSRPDFISRSQCRVRELEQRKQRRRELAASARRPRPHAASRPRTVGSAQPRDNLFKARDRAISGKETALRSKHTVAEVKRKKEEEKKKEASLSNRQRVELFKKRLLDQILLRGNS